ncbi:hypothetical protein JQS43_23850 [Natronosporangium hydrolyticum]|uniref:ARB-07466-like C-terminal domain-containing protein n=1 Tax=Natronosporangium hydrolyticum TaxID=2811111 RepID=A0A895YK51_9ACTN|nr:hypothetical protein [Natronosporangium hydrolyticum]QSB14480.1 hypothetical protein JQS43_23850 [Natronosporangium hydrolyticum]
MIVTAVAAVLVGLLAVPGFAQYDEETDDEGGTRSLRESLDAASTAYQDAQIELEQSEKRELKLLVQLDELAEEREALVDEVQLTASTAYRTGRVGALTALLNSNSPEAFLERVVAVDMLAKREGEQLAKLRELAEEMEEQHSLLADEIAIQEDEVANLEAAKDEAEQALFAIGGGANASFEAFPAEDAAPAPRNSDGSFPSESCSEPDPTTSGCLTPRTLHALNEAQTFGFTRFTSCWRPGDFGEHPLGRACDHSSSANGFGGAAVGADKAYGDRLASFYVHNADALGVQYVIWYRQIWFPGTGWRSYGGSDGTPNGDHTNHVHISIR